jgi:hypothetical protein
MDPGVNIRRKKIHKKECRKEALNNNIKNIYKKLYIINC